MDLKDIRDLLSDPNERVIIIEEGKAASVLMGLEAYRSLKREKHSKAEAPKAAPAGSRSQPEEPSLSRVNAELETDRLKARELAARLAMEASRPEGEPRQTPGRPEVRLADAPEDYSRIRLEDLPL